MDNFETRQYPNSDRRDIMFRFFKQGGDPNERQVIKWSDVEPVMISEDEFKLDDKGRVVYKTVFFLAYPKDIHGHRVRALAEREKESGNQN